jgi:CBS-domain-containing membrane protein
MVNRKVVFLCAKVRRTADSAGVSMRVKDVMTKKVISVSPEASVADALDIVTRSRFAGLPVIDEKGSLVGVVSEADFLRRAELGTAKPGAHWLESIFCREKLRRYMPAPMPNT